MSSTGFDEGDYMKLVAETLKMDDKVKAQSAIMDRYDPEKKLSLVVDEWGVWLAPTPGSNPGFLQQQNSLRDAIIAALNLNIFMRHADRVRMSNIAQMANVLQAMVLTEGPKMLLTPTYHVYKLYLPFQDATLVPVTFEAGTYRLGETSVPRVDAVAATTDGFALAEVGLLLDLVAQHQHVAAAEGHHGVARMQVRHRHRCRRRSRSQAGEVALRLTASFCVRAPDTAR